MPRDVHKTQRMIPHLVATRRLMRFLQTVPAERMPTCTMHCEGTGIQCCWTHTVGANLVRERDAEVAVGSGTPLDVRVAINVAP